MGKYSVFSLLRANRSPSVEELLALEISSDEANVLEPSEKTFSRFEPNTDHVSFVVDWAEQESPLSRFGARFERFNNPRLKPYSVPVWFMLDSALIAVFADTKGLVHQVETALCERLNLTIGRVGIQSHQLERLAVDPVVSNVYEIELVDPKRTTGVNSVAISGHSLLDTDMFPKFKDMNMNISKVVLEVLASSGSTYLATVFHTGVVVLSPYVTKRQVREFLTILSGYVHSEDHHE